jgi:hypothetical protein
LLHSGIHGIFNKTDSSPVRGRKTRVAESHPQGIREKEGIVKRRDFLRYVAAASVVLVVGIPLAESSDGYSPEFFEKLRQRLVALTKRERREVQSFELEPPVEMNGKMFRFVRVLLKGQEERQMAYTWNQPVGETLWV